MCKSESDGNTSRSQCVTASLSFCRYWPTSRKISCKFHFYNFILSTCYVKIIMFLPLKCNMHVAFWIQKKLLIITLRRKTSLYSKQCLSAPSWSQCFPDKGLKLAGDEFLKTLEEKTFCVNILISFFVVPVALTAIEYKIVHMHTGQDRYCGLQKQSDVCIWNSEWIYTLDGFHATAFLTLWISLQINHWIKCCRANIFLQYLAVVVHIMISL